MVNDFLGALLVVKCVQNASTSCLKLLINLSDNVVNHHRSAFFEGGRECLTHDVIQGSREEYKGLEQLKLVLSEI